MLALESNDASCVSYDIYSWKRLKRVIVALKQARSRVTALQQDIENQLKSKETIQELFNKVQQRKVLTGQLRIFLQHRRVTFRLSAMRVAHFRHCLDDRQSRLDDLTAQLERDRGDFDEKVRDYIACREQLVRTNAQLTLRHKEITAQLAEIFHIQRFASSSKGRCACSPLYRIVGVHLPDGEKYSKHSHTEVSTALGYVAQLVQLLSKIFDIPLPYPLHPFGSKSIIRDPSSRLGDGQNVYPLFSRHQDRTMFERGVLLLNQDIVQLRRSFDILTTEHHLTLFNLASLMERLTGLRLDVEDSNHFVYASVSPGGSLRSWSTSGGGTNQSWLQAYLQCDALSASDRSSSLPYLCTENGPAVSIKCDDAHDKVQAS